jgi:hypothetical protein
MQWACMDGAPGGGGNNRRASRSGRALARAGWTAEGSSDNDYGRLSVGKLAPLPPPGGYFGRKSNHLITYEGSSLQSSHSIVVTHKVFIRM